MKMFANDDNEIVPTLLEAMPDEFEVADDHVIHIPTGAHVWAYPGLAGASGVNWGRAGAVLDGNVEYDREDIMSMAMTLLRDRLTKL